MIKFFKDVDRAINVLPAREGDDFVYSYWCPFISAVTLLACVTLLGGLATLLSALISYTDIGAFKWGFYATFYLAAMALTIFIAGGVYCSTRPKKWVFSLPEDPSQTQEDGPVSSRSTSSRTGRA